VFVDCTGAEVDAMADAFCQPGWKATRVSSAALPLPKNSSDCMQVLA
jgi:hypothetical protein